MSTNSNTDFLPLAHTQEFLPPLGRWTTFGAIFIIATIGLIFPLASVIKYREIVKAQASVRPTGELRIVQAATGGQITHISVRENQPVKKGEVIATIDDSRLQTKKSQLQSNIQQAKQQIIQINAQISALNSQIQAERDRINRAVTSAKAELSRRQRDYRDKQIVTAAEVEEAEANLNSVKAALNSARSKRNRYQNAAKQGAISKDQLEEVTLAVRQQEQAVEATMAKLQQTQAALNPSQAEVAIANQEIARERASGEATLANLKREREALIQQQIEISKQLNSDSRELQQVETDLTQAIVSAPIDGVLFKLNLRNSSQSVQPGEEIAQIAPSNVPLMVKAVISPQDIGKLKPKQQVQMRVSACPYPDFGTLKGVVSQISSDTIKPQNNGMTTTIATASNQREGLATAFYEVTIEPESLFLGKGKNQCSIQLGMEGRADIIAREDTVLKFLLRKARLITDF
jgi:HlyD family type I secretion membrane fusion protein